jgi:uncharacterized protein YoxC
MDKLKKEEIKSQIQRIKTSSKEIEKEKGKINEDISFKLKEISQKVNDSTLRYHFELDQKIEELNIKVERLEKMIDEEKEE